MPSLELVVFMEGSGAVVIHALPAGGAVSVGRDEENDIRIDNVLVSRKHAILHVGPPIRVEDLGSRSGTLVRSPRPSAATETAEPLQLRRASAVVGVHESIAFGPVSALIREATTPVVDRGDSRVVQSDVMRQLYEEAAVAAGAKIPVIILGENGVGKEVLADWIHARSGRAKKPFVKQNCAAIPVGLAESVLLGTVRGAYSGAVERAGLLETADGGTVFLDEIGELPGEVQAKLLRVIEDGEVSRVGSTKSRRVDVRYIAATNVDVGAAIQKGTFREDLFHRLNGMKLTIPPLRERVEEIGPLADIFARRAAAEFERDRVPVVSREALALLEAHRWPGNVRELWQAIRRAALMCQQAPNILPEHLPSELRAPPVSASRPLERPSLLTEIETKTREIARRRIVDALDRHGGNQTKAAEDLGVSRNTLINKMRDHGIPGPRQGRGRKSG